MNIKQNSNKHSVQYILPVVLLLCSLLCGCFERNTAVSGPDDLEQAKIYLRQRDFIEAEKSFERYLRRNPDGENRWEVWNQLVDMAMDIRHNRKSAVELLEAMLLEYENNPNPAYLRQVQERLAGEYLELRNFDRAISLWERILASPNISENYRARGLRKVSSIQKRKLDFDTAEALLKQCMQLDIDNAEKQLCQYDLADMYMTREDLKAGVKEINKLLASDELDDKLRVLTIFMLADAKEQQGDKQKALVLFDSIRYSYPNLRVIESRVEYLKNQLK